MNRPMSRPMSRRPGTRASRALDGFTLLEVMVALAILAVALVGLIGRTARNARLTREMGMLDVATDLTRSKMYDIEAELLKEGFPETDQEEEGDFSDEGWRDIKWHALVEKVELPNLTTLDSLQDGEAEAGATGGLGGMLGGLGGGAAGAGGKDGGGMDMSMGMSVIASQFDLFKQVLEVSIRKVTLKVTWSVGNTDEEMVVACYFTDPYGMSRAIRGLGSLGGGSSGDSSSGGGSSGSSGGGTPFPRGGGASQK